VKTSRLDQIKELEKQLFDQDKREVALIKVLKFYANEMHYRNHMKSLKSLAIDNDHGAKARAAIEMNSVREEGK